jgi:ribonuclease HI
MTAGYYILNTDGGMSSSGRRAKDERPGEAAIAVVLKKTKKGRKTESVIESFGRRIGPRMNDVAEYEALLEGLRTAIKHEATHVRAFMDSEFVVEQINNGVPPKEKDLVPLYKEARKLIKQFAPGVGFRLSWVPRQRNAEADALVRDALAKPAKKKAIAKKSTAKKAAKKRKSSGTAKAYKKNKERVLAGETYRSRKPSDWKRR